MGRACGADAVISIGGGSVMDTAKGIAILLKEGGSLLDYQGFQVLTRRQTPHIAIPTTAGTGSEVTYVAVVKDHQKKQKLLFGDYHIIPDTAILDPALTVDLPPRLTAATGLDAFSHGLEALSSAQREPVADALGLHAIRLIKEFLPRALKNGADLAARGQMLIAASLGGAAFSNAQVGLIHAIAHVVGARHGVHHGMANAILMPHVMRFNNSVVADRFRLAAEAMGADVRGMSDEAAGLCAAAAIEAFVRENGSSHAASRRWSAAGRPGSVRGGCPVRRLDRLQRAACSGSRRSAGRAEGGLVKSAASPDAADGQDGSSGRSAGAHAPALPISLGPRTEDAGLASMLAELIRLNLAAHPGRRKDFDRLNADIVIEARDAEVTITLAFGGGTLIVHAGVHGDPGIRISADSATVLELSTLRIIGGVPSLLGAKGRRLIGKLAAGEVKIRGLRRVLTLVRLDPPPVSRQLTASGLGALPDHFRLVGVTG